MSPAQAGAADRVGAGRPGHEIRVAEPDRFREAGAHDPDCVDPIDEELRLFVQPVSLPALTTLLTTVRVVGLGEPIAPVLSDFAV